MIGADVNVGAGDKNVREEEGGFLHMDGVYPLLNFSLMYFNLSVSASLLRVGADPSRSLISIIQRGYHVDEQSLKILLQAGALLDVNNFDIATFLLESDVISWDVVEIVLCDFSVVLSAYSLSWIRLLLKQYEDTMDNHVVIVGYERKQVLTGVVPETLKHICRRLIRKTCGNIRLFFNVDRLIIPYELKRFLLFDYNLYQV